MITKQLNEINSKYNYFFDNKNYQEVKPVDISSRFDPTVNYIGSAISVLKPLFLEHRIDSTGNYLVQRAIRTRGLSNIQVEEKTIWSSFFRASGVLVNYNNLNILVQDTIELLNKSFDFPLDNILIRISSKDTDLVSSIDNIDGRVIREFDTRPISYYKHKYGLSDLGIYGRNFNIALKNNNNYMDIGNIIVIESNKEKYGVECAIGLNSILMCINDIKTSLEASTVADILDIDEHNFKFADCLTVVSNLAYEDINSVKGRGQTYLYRKYLKSLIYWQNKLQISDFELINMIREYMLLEYNEYSEQKINDNVLKLIKK